MKQKKAKSKMDMEEKSGMGNWIKRIEKSVCSVVKKSIVFIMKLTEPSPCYIVHIDGGGCSQMDQYLYGRVLQECGKRVQYDLSWYDECGMDVNGKHVRNFELLQLFPELSFDKSSDKTVRKYKKWFYYRNTQQSNGELPSMPRYLDGYYYDVSRWVTREEYLALFKKMFNINLDNPNIDADNKRMVSEILKEELPVGIHVRRGDMAGPDSFQRELDAGYFIKAIEILKDKSSFFYIFSDEPEWIRENLESALSGLRYEIMEINGPDKGWCDLLLMSLCKYQVASQGSMGKYAYLLNKNEDKMIYMPDRAENHSWCKGYEVDADRVKYIKEE